MLENITIVLALLAPLTFIGLREVYRSITYYFGSEQTRLVNRRRYWSGLKEADPEMIALYKSLGRKQYYREAERLDRMKGRTR